MTPKSDPAPISEERLEEIEKACSVPCPSCKGEGKNEEGTWVCKPCAGTGRWLTSHGGFILFQPARIAAYVDRQKAPLLERIQKLEGQRNGWATKRHASWCCGSGDSCCCGHEEAISGLTSKQVEAEMAEPDEMDRKVREALEEFGDAVNDALIIGEVITIDKIVLMRRTIRDILAEKAKP